MGNQKSHLLRGGGESWGLLQAFCFRAYRGLYGHRKLTAALHPASTSHRLSLQILSVYSWSHWSKASRSPGHSWKKTAQTSNGKLCSGAISTSSAGPCMSCKPSLECAVGCGTWHNHCPDSDLVSDGLYFVLTYSTIWLLLCPPELTAVAKLVKTGESCRQYRPDCAYKQDSPVWWHHGPRLCGRLERAEIRKLFPHKCCSTQKVSETAKERGHSHSVSQGRQVLQQKTLPVPAPPNI